MVRNQKRERQWGTDIDRARGERERERGADSVVASKTVTKNNENFYMPTTQSFNVFLLQVWWIFPQTWAHGDEVSGPVICIDRL